MRITSDWHIHSRNSCDDASMAVSDLISEAETRGIVDFGLSDLRKSRRRTWELKPKGRGRWRR